MIGQALCLQEFLERFLVFGLVPLFSVHRCHGVKIDQVPSLFSQIFLAFLSKKLLCCHSRSKNDCPQWPLLSRNLDSLHPLKYQS